MKIVTYEPTGSGSYLNPIIKVTMDSQVDPDSLSKYTCLLGDIYGNTVKRVIDYDSNTRSIKIYPVGLLKEKEHYTVIIKGRDGVKPSKALSIKGLDGKFLEESFSFEFITGDEINQDYPFVKESIEAGFKKVEGGESIKAYVASETGEPTAYVTVSAGGVSQDGTVVDHDEGSAVFFEGIYKPETLPPKTSKELAITRIYPRQDRFRPNQESFIVYFNDMLEVWMRNTYGIGIYGEAYYEDFIQTMRYFFEIYRYVPFSDMYDIEGTYTPIEYDIEYIPDLNAVRLNFLNETGWNAKEGELQDEIIDWNSVYVLKVRKELEGLTTQPLTKDYEFVYLSDFWPLYCGVQAIKATVALYDSQNYDDNFIKLLIFKASLEADSIIATHNTTLSPVVIKARQRYVCCLVKYWILTREFLNNSKIVGISEQLGDYKYSINKSARLPENILEDIKECIENNEDILINEFNIPKGKSAVRGKYDTRQPQVDRWPNKEKNSGLHE